MEAEKTYPIPASLMVAISRYLQTQPWAQVNELMFGITRVCQPIDEAEVRAAQMANSGFPMPPNAGGEAQLNGAAPPLPTREAGPRRKRPQLVNNDDDKEPV